MIYKVFKVYRIAVWILLVLAILFAIIFYSFRAPSEFVPGTIVTVSQGEDLRSIAQNLKEQHVISSILVFSNAVILKGGERNIKAGDYIFLNRENVLEVAERFTTGNFGLKPSVITIPEGTNIETISILLKNKLEGFDQTTFLSLARQKEGFLFPDTYYIFPSEKPQAIILRMQENFQSKIAPLLPAIATSTRSLHTIITMASLLEGEAKSVEDKKIVAGILWKRLKENMKLQIDAPFVYLLNKHSGELTVRDLDIDSPYNTYRYPGLTPTPISNPGLDAINAALYPTETPYYFFISDKEGTMHYAKTGEQHLKNVQKYLR